MNISMYVCILCIHILNKLFFLDKKLPNKKFPFSHYRFVIVRYRIYFLRFNLILLTFNMLKQNIISFNGVDCRKNTLADFLFIFCFKFYVANRKYRLR